MTNLRYHTILFDLDGTLTDSYEGITKCVEYALREMNYPVDNRDQLRAFIGPPLLNSFMKFCGMEEQQAQAAISKYRERFRKIGWKENKLYPGTEQMLHALQASGAELFIASSKPAVFVERILAYFKIDGYFSAVIAADLHGGLQEKNDIIRACIQKASVPAEQILMIGDRKFDAQGALENGVDFIGTCYGFGGRDELAAYPFVYLANSTEEITTFLTGN